MVEVLKFGFVLIMFGIIYMIYSSIKKIRQIKKIIRSDSND